MNLRSTPGFFARQRQSIIGAGCPLGKDITTLFVHREVDTRTLFTPLRLNATTINI